MRRYRLSGLRVPVSRPLDAALAGSALGLDPSSIGAFRIARRSIDARRKPLLFFEAAVEIETASPLDPGRVEPPLLLEELPSREGQPGPGPLLAPLPPSVAASVAPSVAASRPRVAVVGTGPAGLFAALALAEAGLSPLVLERGDPAEERYRRVMRFWKGGEFDPESNVQFGEGGAGTFSDGKLTCGKRHAKILVVLETLRRFGAPESILYDAKPHIGTDRLVVVLRNVRRHLLEAGCSIRYRARVVDIVRRGADGPLAALVLSTGEEVPVDAAILALGHSARDTVARLVERGVAASAKSFAMGVRIEHPQDAVDLIQYGVLSASCGIGPADYKQTHAASNGRGVYTFCMCPGGEVIACSSEPGGVVTNGMSRYRRASGFANSGLVVQTRPEDFAAMPGPEALRGQAFQREVERRAFALGGGTYAAPAIRVTDFLARGASRREPRPLPKGTYGPAVVPCRLEGIYPAPYLDALDEAIRAFDRKMRGFVSEEAVLVAPESRTSSPVRLERDAACESPTLPGLFPAGEGAGFAGGIVSAALDGLRVARAVAARLSGERVPDGYADSPPHPSTGPEY